MSSIVKKKWKKLQLPVTFSGNTHAGVLSIEDADKEQNKLFDYL